jgi:hypothetical protein
MYTSYDPFTRIVITNTCERRSFGTQMARLHNVIRITFLFSLINQNRGGVASLLYCPERNRNLDSTRRESCYFYDSILPAVNEHTDTPCVLLLRCCCCRLYLSFSSRKPVSRAVDQLVSIFFSFVVIYRSSCFPNIFLIPSCLAFCCTTEII